MPPASTHGIYVTVSHLADWGCVEIRWGSTNGVLGQGTQARLGDAALHIRSADTSGARASASFFPNFPVGLNFPLAFPHSTCEYQVQTPCSYTQEGGINSNDIDKVPIGGTNDEIGVAYILG